MRVSKLIALTFAGLMFTMSVVHADETTAAAAGGARTSDVTSSTDDDDRMVCEYEKRVGTHMKTRICKTVAQRRLDRERAQKEMDKRVICGTGCNR